MNRIVQQLREATWPRTARETVAKLREEFNSAKRIKSRDAIFESDRCQQWHHRQNVIHRFANGQTVEIKLTGRDKP